MVDCPAELLGAVTAFQEATGASLLLLWPATSTDRSAPPPNADVPSVLSTPCVVVPDAAATTARATLHELAVERDTDDGIKKWCRQLLGKVHKLHAKNSVLPQQQLATLLGMHLALSRPGAAAQLLEARHLLVWGGVSFVQEYSLLWRETLTEPDFVLGIDPFISERAVVSRKMPHSAPRARPHSRSHPYPTASLLAQRASAGSTCSGHCLSGSARSTRN
jgi:hypothetical protein